VGTAHLTKISSENCKTVQSMVGRLEPVKNLRHVWAKEAKDFTTWLANNLDILSEQLGLELTVLESEKSVGPFAADILAEDQVGHVVIENQLERTDHDHLGKLITYLSNLDAKTAIWITSDPRPEHVRAIEYLNEVSPEDTKFYLVQIKAFKIGGSEPAPYFNVVAGPSSEVKSRGEIKKEFAEKDQKRLEFFRQLLEYSNERTPLFKNVSPAGYQNWVNAGAGRSGLAWAYVVRRNDARAELYIYSPDPGLTQRRFQALNAKKEEIEAKFGEALEWDFNENRKQHYIRSWTKIGGIENEDQWPAIQNDLVSRMVRLEKALRPYLASLP
jgi:hypothetical protein